MIEHPGRPSGLVDGPDEVRRKVRELVRMGADVIKVATSGGVLSPRDDPRHAHFRPIELEAIVEEATAAGIFVMAHAQGADGIKNAVRAGIRSIDHGIYLDDEGIELMKASAGPGSCRRSSRRRASSTPRMPASRCRRSSSTRHARSSTIHRAAFRHAVEAGVRIAMGTDCGVTPHGQNLRELRPHGRRRDDAGGGPRGDDAERRRSCSASTRTSGRSRRASSPTSSS